MKNRRLRWITVSGMVAMGGYAATAGAQGSGAFILPGQPFEAGQPKTSTATGQTSDSYSSTLLGGRFSEQSKSVLRESLK